VLSLEAVPPGTGADVEHAAAYEAERGLLGLRPVVVLGEEALRAQRRPDGAVLTLELGLSRASIEMVEQQPPKGVLAALEDPGYAASEVRRPSSPAMGRIAATTFRMCSSSSSPSSSAPA
jgi:hypothetical protein